MFKILVLVVAALTIIIWQLWPTIYQAGLTATLEIGEGTTKQLSLSEMKRVDYARITIYFDPKHQAHEKLANELAKELHTANRIIEQHLGLHPQSLPVVLVPQEAGVGKVILKGMLAMPIVLPPSAASLEDIDFLTGLFIYWALPHESVEAMIAPVLYLHDRSSRWIGDGLAQYAGYLVTRELFPQGFDRIMRGELRRVEMLLSRRINRYDLTQDFLVRKGGREELFSSGGSKESAGYAVSLAFWLDISRRYDEEVIQEFWHRVSQLSRCVLYVICLTRPTAKGAAQILSELTGEDIWNRIQALDLQEVLNILEAARSESSLLPVSLQL